MAPYALALFFTLVVSSSAVDIPDFLRVCSRNDPNINACITDSVEHLRPYLLKGVPEYNLPTLEPLLIKEIAASQGAGIRVVVSNIHAFGASNFIVKRVMADLENLVFNVDIDLPHLFVDGHYEVDGRVLLLPITGSGPLKGNFTDCTGAVIFRGEIKKGSDGLDHFHVYEFSMKITVGHGHLDLENLFNGEKILGDVVNSAINSNFDAFAHEILPLIEKGLSESFLEIGNNIVGPFPFDQLFPA